jgi:hypothetical protein
MGGATGETGVGGPLCSGSGSGWRFKASPLVPEQERRFPSYRIWRNAWGVGKQLEPRWPPGQESRLSLRGRPNYEFAMYRFQKTVMETFECVEVEQCEIP